MAVRRSRLRRMLGRAEQAGILVAAANVPKTYQRSLMPRSSLDQGIVTGLSMALDYVLAALVQDGVEALTREVLGASHLAEVDDTEWRRATLVLDVAAMCAGFGIQEAFRQHEGEPLARAAVRTAGFWLSTGAFAGGLVGGLQDAMHDLDRSDGDRDLRSFPAALPAGAVLAGIGEYTRRRREEADGDGEEWHMSAARSLAFGVGVSAALSGIAAAERTLARTVGRLLARRLPGGEHLWRGIGHLVAFGALGGVVKVGMHRAATRVETGERRLEPAFHRAPASTLVSGGPGSVVAFETLSKQGRRNVCTALRRHWIEHVLGEPAASEPIRVFVSLDSAPTEDARVALAVAELERTGAFERSLLMVVSPTGTGYVNYVAVEAAEYLARGDVASVTLQYSERPSVMSLDRVWEGRRQNRALLDAIGDRLQRTAPGRRPRVVLFGESLGAHTSQDAFLHEGTRGLQEAGVDRALWIGTPYASGWKREVLGPARADVDPSLVGVFNDFGQVEALDPEARSRLRYVMITHDNDAVAKFGLDLLVQAPEWLGDPTLRPATVPRSEGYSSPETFLITLADMKNSANVVPGDFEAKGHDYRADLARFVREVYALDATAAQMERIEAALRRAELVRKERIDVLDGKA